MTNAQLNALLSKTVKAPSHGEFELFQDVVDLDSTNGPSGMDG